MAFQVVFHPQASKEFGEAYRWYEERLTGLGERFADAIGERLKEIATSPLLYPRKKDSYRATKAKTFPYLIVYKVYQKKKVLFVSAIYHTSRNPRKKYRK